MLAALAADDTALVVLIVAARLFIPLLIPGTPLLIIAAFTLDAVDGSLLEQFTSVDTSPGGSYQSWDKALDIYYLSIAYVSTMRNWTSVPAFRIARFLFYYRLVGIAAFELTGDRWVLLLFPNTFEFFFIAYEAFRTRFEPSRFSARTWLLIAAGLWIFVKLPQEYWIHVAQLDFTDAVENHPWFGWLSAAVVAGVLAVLWFGVRPRLPEPSWNLLLRATPASANPAGERQSRSLIGEKIALLALLCFVFAQILPGIDATAMQLTVGVSFVVMANTLLTRLPSAALLAANLVLIYIASLILTGAADFQLGAGLFFAFLLTLIIVLYDRYSGGRSSGDRWPSGAPPPL